MHIFIKGKMVKLSLYIIIDHAMKMDGHGTTAPCKLNLGARST
jgi:hypothetical protein